MLNVLLDLMFISTFYIVLLTIFCCNNSLTKTCILQETVALMINAAQFLRLFFSFPKLMMNPESVAALVLNRTTMTPVIQKSVSKSVPKKIPMDWLVVIRGTQKTISTRD